MHKYLLPLLKIPEILLIILLGFIIGYLVDILIEKLDIFGTTLHHYYKLAGSGFYGGLAIVFSIIISYILQIYLLPNLLINS